MSDGRRWWRLITLAAAALLYVVATSNRAYDLTTPATMPMHTAARKILALLAFALIGLLLQKCDLRAWNGTIRVGIALTLYSFAIEIGQVVIGHSRESLAQHGFDIASGLVGGAAGALAVLVATSPFTFARRCEAIALALLAIGLGLWFPATYGRNDAASADLPAHGASALMRASTDTRS
jgi:hypothetical protein